MGPDIYEVSNIGSGRLCVMAKPTSGEWIDEEFDAIKAFGISRVVSLLEAPEAYSVGLSHEERYCRDRGIDFVQYEIKDREIPDSETDFLLLIQALHSGIAEGLDTVIHCRAGIGRTGVVAAAILIKHGLGGSESFDTVSAARCVQVPDTEQQKEYVLALETKLQR